MSYKIVVLEISYDKDGRINGGRRGESENPFPDFGSAIACAERLMDGDDEIKIQIVKCNGGVVWDSAKGPYPELYS